MVRHKAGAEPRRLRVYQQWQGNERFFCWGHCVTGPSWRSGLGSLALLIAPTVVFLALVAPYMSERVSPLIMVVSCILPLFCASMLLLTSCTDPGILPRQEPDEEWLAGHKPRAKDVSVNGHRVTVRYNDTAHFYQPPRAHHCSVNDNCIERFDHHCPWVGTTIGKRNYRTFLLFIYGTSVYIAWTFGVSLGSLFVRHGELEAAAGGAGTGDSLSSNLWLQTLGQSGAALALMIFTFIFFWFVCGLSGFHTWLVATNQTTYENFRYNHSQVPNPYSEGLLRNCASVWCVRVPPSKVQFRAYLDEVTTRVPVELGYPEWPGQLPTQRAPSTLDASPGQPLGAPQQAGGWPGGADGGPLHMGLAGAPGAASGGSLGSTPAHYPGDAARGAAMPPAAQTFDSITEAAPSQLPIARSAAQPSLSLAGSMASTGGGGGGGPAPLSAASLPDGAGVLWYEQRQQEAAAATVLQQQQAAGALQQQQQQQQQQQCKLPKPHPPSPDGQPRGGWAAPANGHSSAPSASATPTASHQEVEVELAAGGAGSRRSNSEPGG